VDWRPSSGCFSCRPEQAPNPIASMAIVSAPVTPRRSRESPASTEPLAQLPRPFVHRAVRPSRAGGLTPGEGLGRYLGNAAAPIKFPPVTSPATARFVDVVPRASHERSAHGINT